MSPRPESPAEPILEMIGISVASLQRPDSVRLEDVDWSVRQGEYWVIGGRPASGKSDLLATAAGLLRPRQGTHRLFGKDTMLLDEDEKVEIQVRLGMVFGSGGRLFSHLTAAENMALPLCYHRNCSAEVSAQRVEALVQALELGPIADSPPRALHRSLQQRVALARALVLSPELLFFDDPLDGLDPREARWWLDFLGALCQGHPILDGKRLTLVVGTDDLEPWRDRAQYFAVINNHRLVPVSRSSHQQPNPGVQEMLPDEWFK